jgi:uncharacterized protein HemX
VGKVAGRSGDKTDVDRTETTHSAFSSRSETQHPGRLFYCVIIYQFFIGGILDMSRNRLLLALLLIVAIGTAATFAVQRQKAQKLAEQERQKAQQIAEQERQRAVKALAIDDLHRECEEMQAKAKRSRNIEDIGLGLQIMSYEWNVKSAINGTLDQDSEGDVSVMMQGHLTPEIKLRVMADAAKRIEAAQKIYDAARSLK